MTNYIPIVLFKHLQIYFSLSKEVSSNSTWRVSSNNTTGPENCYECLARQKVDFLLVPLSFHMFQTQFDLKYTALKEIQVIFTRLN